MASRKISQREARQTKKQSREWQRKYEALTSRYACDYPGIQIRSLTVIETTREVLATANRLGFSIAAKIDGDVLKLYAVKPQ